MNLEPGDFDISCTALVELVTDYLEGTLPGELLARVEAHLSVCPGCVSAVDQIREVVRLTGRLTEASIEQMPDQERDNLTSVFRDLHPRA
jgi:predicted anti-sigma-YlaC factor YlaD